MFGAAMGSCVICRSHGRALSAFELLPRFEEPFSATPAFFAFLACFFSIRLTCFPCFFPLLRFRRFLLRQVGPPQSICKYDNVQGRVWPEPRTTYLKVVSCSTPTGPRA